MNKLRKGKEQKGSNSCNQFRTDKEGTEMKQTEGKSPGTTVVSGKCHF